MADVCESRPSGIIYFDTLGVRIANANIQRDATRRRTRQLHNACWSGWACNMIPY